MVHHTFHGKLTLYGTKARAVTEIRVVITRPGDRDWPMLSTYRRLNLERLGHSLTSAIDEASMRRRWCVAAPGPDGPFGNVDPIDPMTGAIADEDDAAVRLSLPDAVVRAGALGQPLVAYIGDPDDNLTDGLSMLAHWLGLRHMGARLIAFKLGDLA
jgi:hypothetical protein